MKPKAVVLLSGGLDSAVTLAIAQSEGFSAYALSFSYGQRHVMELKSAGRIAKSLDVEKHLVLAIELGKIGGSALTDRIEVPKDRFTNQPPKEIPATYVPARNTIFLSFALGWAEVLKAETIFIGANAVDFSGYPDCRPEYIQAFETMANLATRAAVEKSIRIHIKTPLIRMSKAQIIQKGMALGVNFSLTHSCYDPSKEGISCGRCDSCMLRRKGFREAGLIDPIPYAG
ncbi:MAG: 7-cyano-7-deazaguanine synthase QueC [Desulfobacterales bacterium CG23_combo_of_CG06-09_8_20_14_all_52_9]|nr:MAG: 7-cyano-7-deazaguanine synthase QueC [Desulfobacterales bacterium CG23_combo_of_CG06-09_8_20_14_all_52_9]